MSKFLLLLLSILLISISACEDDDDSITPNPPTGMTVDRISFPPGSIFPEGIARTGEGTFYAGSLTTGALYVASAGAQNFSSYVPQGEQLSTALGVEIFGTRMLVAGGATRQLQVIDLATNTSSVVTAPAVEADSSLLNDASITGSGEAYVTDSYAPFIYRLPVRGSSLEVAYDLRGSGIEYQAGFNLNGIVTTLDDRYLISVQTNTGNLYRINLQDGTFDEIDITGEGTLLAGDGLTLDVNTLYVAINQSNEVAVVDLSDDYASGTITRRIQQNFQFPTALTAQRNALYVLNAQLPALSGQAALQLPFTAVRVDL